MQQNQPTQKKNNSSGFDKYVKYSGLAFQMLIIILVFVWTGKKIDEKYFAGEPVFIIVFSLFGVGIAIYIAVKDLINISRKK